MTGVTKLVTKKSKVIVHKPKVSIKRPGKKKIMMPEKMRARMLDKEADIRLQMNKKEEEKYKKNNIEVVLPVLPDTPAQKLFQPQKPLKTNKLKAHVVNVVHVPPNLTTNPKTNTILLGKPVYTQNALFSLINKPPIGPRRKLRDPELPTRPSKNIPPPPIRKRTLPPRTRSIDANSFENINHTKDPHPTSRATELIKLVKPETELARVNPSKTPDEFVPVPKLGGAVPSLTGTTSKPPATETPTTRTPITGCFQGTPEEVYKPGSTFYFSPLPITTTPPTRRTPRNTARFTPTPRDMVNTREETRKERGAAKIQAAFMERKQRRNRKERNNKETAFLLIKGQRNKQKKKTKQKSTTHSSPKLVTLQ